MWIITLKFPHGMLLGKSGRKHDLRKRIVYTSAITRPSFPFEETTRVTTLKLQIFHVILPLVEENPHHTLFANWNTVKITLHFPDCTTDRTMGLFCAIFQVSI